ncbi:hypothetical protein AKJ09_03667 [Labilithrix luteola]|uniref:Uncharacterized protein n=1 Tax=Labilithrix luteola TaxID=1391654 RepID=A0A0K1PTY6_9BACT|nr:hypothetical protein [Labilithrix luteola]AKU97003.1 hypothetical protein AKJ09_03667 [Labilithrix luteola]
MGRPRSLANMLKDIRQRTNMENSMLVTDDELTEYLNQEIAELWGQLTRNQGQPFLRSQTSIDVVPNVALYSLPADFWTLQEVTATYGGITRPMRPFMTAERGYLVGNLAIAPFVGAKYRLQGNNIEFLPANLGFKATVFYTPACPRLTQPGDIFDGFNGYEMAPIYGVCATVREKEETDPSFYENRKAAFFTKIDALSAHRDMSNPERIQDVSGDQFDCNPDVAWWWL